MSDSPNSLNSLGIETEEIFSDDEPATKRTKISEISEDSEDRQQKEDVVGNLHKLVMHLSDSFVNLNEKVLKVEHENFRLIEKNSKLEAKFEEIQLENSQLQVKLSDMEKSINDAKLSMNRKNYRLESRISNVETEIEENLEVRVTSIEKEYNETMECAEEKQEKWNSGVYDKLALMDKNSIIVQKSLETEIDNLKKTQESSTSQLEYKVCNAEMVINREFREIKKDSEQSILELKEKLRALEQAHAQNIKEYHIYQLQQRVSNMESGFNACKEWVTLIDKKIEGIQEEKNPDFNRIVKIEQAGTSSSIESESLENYKHYIHSDDCEDPPTAAELEFQFKCIFCGLKSHESIDCTAFSHSKFRIRALKEDFRCTRCLDICDPSEPHACPRANVMCSNCQWDTKNAEFPRDFHHAIVCHLNDKRPCCQNRRRTENNRRLAHGVPPRFIH